MHKMLFMFAPGLILLALVIFSFFMVIVSRGRQIPRCFQCGAYKVRPSRPAGIFDTIANLVLIRSYRCAGCLARFHAFRLSNRTRQPFPS
jgi:hypothetical protein